MINFGFGAVACKMLLVMNASWIFDYCDVSSSRNNPRTANGYKCWNLQLYKNHSFTIIKSIKHVGIPGHVAEKSVYQNQKLIF